MESSALDERYGALRTPDEVDDWEVACQPVSLTVLSSETASGLHGFLEAPILGFEGARLLAAECRLLWLVTSVGTVAVALEEVIQADGQEVCTPRMRAADYPKMRRLGHPALVKGDAGRIGGEIIYDPKTQDWIINNYSGRYGRADFGRTSNHLEAVQSDFLKYGIKLTHDFY